MGIETLSPEQLAGLGRKFSTGLVTLLFTDIVGSTELKHRLGDLPAANLLLRHHALV